MEVMPGLMIREGNGRLSRPLLDHAGRIELGVATTDKNALAIAQALQSRAVNS
jgi:hypothetical protein